MGVPKQKWTPEEESTLKAGVKKHGIGKWRNILRDPEFSMELRLRSNIDLKDKWRNMTMTGTAWSLSRERAKSAKSVKSANRTSRRLPRSKVLEEEGDYNPLAISSKLEDNVINVTPISSTPVPLEIESKMTKKPLKRLNSLILEAITQLQEQEGSNNTSIAMYIEENYRVPPDFQNRLSAKLRTLVDSGKLIKINRNYKLAPSSTGLQVQAPRTKNDDIRKQMMIIPGAGCQAVTIQEAADSAAKAVAEADILEAEAKEAIRIAEKFESDAQATQTFVETVILHLKNRNPALLMIQA